MGSACVVYTARVTYAGADRLDVTRKSAGPEGLPFAPLWAILSPMLEAWKRWRAALTAFADRVIEEGDLWSAYVHAYRHEMRASYKAHRAAWDALLARERVTLVCYCTDPLRCHRTLLARSFLTALGARYDGERHG